jgi:hypothetical protein
VSSLSGQYAFNNVVSIGGKPGVSNSNANSPGGESGNGFLGGLSNFAFIAASGGGGGAGGAGTNATASASTGGSGGPGLSSTITGSTVFYGGGGGGSGGTNNVSPGTGGSGGGGTKANGSANTGGGAAGGNSAVNNSYAGGSGIVIVRIPTTTYSTYSGTATVTTSGTDTIISFTAGTGSVTMVNNYTPYSSNTGMLIYNNAVVYGQLSTSNTITSVNNLYSDSAVNASLISPAASISNLLVPNANITIGSGGSLSNISKYSFLAYNPGATQTIPTGSILNNGHIVNGTTWTSVTTSGLTFNSASGLVLVPSTGFYMVSTSIVGNANTAGASSMSVLISGGLGTYFIYGAQGKSGLISGSNFATVSLSTCIFLPSSAGVSVSVEHNGTTGMPLVNSGSDNCRFSVVMI